MSRLKNITMKKKIVGVNTEKNITPVKCDCGGEFQKKGISRLKKSIQHQNWVATQNNNF